jgi:two-component system chemotaxis response regulator CheB
MPTHDIVVMCASAGGIAALQDVLSQLPYDLAASIFVTLHTAPTAPGNALAAPSEPEEV